VSLTLHFLVANLQLYQNSDLCVLWLSGCDLLQAADHSTFKHDVETNVAAWVKVWY
jgi:hypothetical protein